MDIVIRASWGWHELDFLLGPLVPIRSPSLSKSLRARWTVLRRKGILAMREGGELYQPLLFSMAFVSCWLLVGAQRAQLGLGRASHVCQLLTLSGLGAWEHNKDFVQP